MDDLISRRAAIDTVHKAIFDFFDICDDDEESPMTYKDKMLLELNKAIATQIKTLPSAERMSEWIPVTARPMDTEERLEWSEKLGYDIEYNEALIYTSQLPDDGQEVLVCGRYGRVWIDKFENDPDYGCCFEENGDMDGIIAWMPSPEPYKGEEE